MKNFNLIITTSLTLISLTACSPKTEVAPSQNEALNNISSSTAQKENNGAMQTSLDRWLKDDWTPTIENNKTIKTINKDKDRDFKLQEYVDKSEVYMEEKKKKTSTEKSHYEKIKSMPVIGN